MSLGVIGALAASGVGAGIYLGNAAIAEINPIHFQEPPTRFHADLSPYRPVDTAPRAMLARMEEPSLGTGCVGCRTYPEEAYPVRAASFRSNDDNFVEQSEPARVVEAELTPDPETERLRRDMDRVATYALGGGEEVAYASVQGQPEAAQEPVAAAE